MRSGCRPCTLASLFCPLIVCILPPRCFVLSHLEGRLDAQGVAAPHEQNVLGLDRGCGFGGGGRNPSGNFSVFDWMYLLCIYLTRKMNT